MAKTSISKSKIPKLSKLLPERVARILGDRPTIAFEDNDAYDMLHAEMIIAFDPRDIQEHFLVKDATDAQWQYSRYCEMLSAAVEVKMPEASFSLIGSEYMLISGSFHWPTAQPWLTKTVRKAVSGDAANMQQLERCCERAGVSLRHLKTAAFTLALPTVSILWDLASKAEKRRGQAITRLMERRKYQSAMACRQPAASKDITEVNMSDEAAKQQEVPKKLLEGDQGK